MADLFGEADKWAELSDCGNYRYALGRRWGDGPRMLFIMLNPSTADHIEDDPTIKRCMGFAKREGCESIEVVNLFALRASKPKFLTRYDFHTTHGGNATTNWTLDAISRSDIIIAAWGADKMSGRGWRYLMETLDHHAPDITMHHLGPLTKDGFPRHPLYLAKSAPLSVWRSPELESA